MRPINSQIINVAQRYFRELAESPSFRDLKPPSELGDVGHSSGTLAPGRQGSDPNKRFHMAQDSFQSLIDNDRTPAEGHDAVSTYDPGSGADVDDRPGKVMRFEPVSNKANSPAVIVADFTGDASNGYAMSSTTNLDENGQAIFVTQQAVRIQNGHAETVTMEIFSQEGSRPQVVVNVAEMSQGCPNPDSSGRGSYQRWQMNPEQLGYLMMRPQESRHQLLPYEKGSGVMNFRELP
jgi:hypothetical protein